jgi:hypothetical protein
MPRSQSSGRSARGANAAERVRTAERLEHAACRSIIMRIAERGPAFRQPDELPRFLDVVRQTYPAAHRRQLEGIIGMEDGYDTCESRAFVYAEMVPRGTPRLWPVLAFAADRASRQLKVRAALFFEAEEEGTGRRGPRAVGWRFEPPEGSIGAHSYYHAQPISAWDNSGDRGLPVFGVLNEVYPAFPLMAENSLSLLAGMLVSLYGRTGAGDLLGDSQIADTINPVRPTIERWLRRDDSEN